MQKCVSADMFVFSSLNHLELNQLRRFTFSDLDLNFISDSRGREAQLSAYSS